MNVVTAVLAAPGDHTKMKHFTIDTQNNITVHASRKAARDTGAGVFASEVQLADLIGPDNKRLLEIWNSLPGVRPVSKFTNRKVATERIWKAIQGLEEPPAAAPTAEPQSGAIEGETVLAELPASEPNSELAQTEPPIDDATPQITREPYGVGPVDQPAEADEPVATVGTQAPSVAPAEDKSSKAATTANKAPKAQKAAKPAKAESGPREGSKTAQVVAMLQRKDGATLAEIMDQMGWQKHTVRGFMAGAMKKAGYTVESFKSDKSERTYRIKQ
jgi:hypothetical protein